MVSVGKVNNQIVSFYFQDIKAVKHCLESEYCNGAMGEGPQCNLIGLKFLTKQRENVNFPPANFFSTHRVRREYAYKIG